MCASHARARCAKPGTLGPCTRKGHCKSERPPFLRSQPVLPRAGLPLTARGHLRVERACAPLRSLSLETRPSTCASNARARRAEPVTHGPCIKEGLCTSERPPFLRRQAGAPMCKPSLSLRVVACACSALARHCARSPWGRGPARALLTRARAAPSRERSDHVPRNGTARARGRRSFGARPVLPRASLPLTARGGMRV